MPIKQNHPPSLLSRLYPSLRLAPLTPLRIAGFFPTIIVLGIIALAYLTAVPATLLPLLPFHPLLTPPLLLAFHILFLLTLINYILLLLIDPGSPPPTWSSPPPPHPFPYAHLMHQRTHHGQLRYCFTCSAFKPDRAHHCSICNRCILRMDHHCVFINNCVSFHNHKFFVSFITTAFLGSLFVTIVSLPTFSAIISTTPPSYIHHHPTPVISPAPPSRLWHSASQSIQTMSPTLRTLAMIGYITTAAFAFALAIFVILHFYLLSKGRTTIEMYELADSFRRRDVLAYDLGIRKNFASICGTVPLCWLVPTRAFVEGDGLDWERAELPEERGPLNA